MVEVFIGVVDISCQYIIVMSVVGAGSNTRLQLGSVRQHDTSDTFKQWIGDARTSSQGALSQIIILSRL